MKILNRYIAIYLTFLWILMFQSAASGQLEDLGFYADAMFNSASGEHRIRANDSVVVHLEKTLSNHNGMELDWSSVPWISVLGADSLGFKLCTWEINIDDRQYRAFGYLIKEDGDFIRLNPLSDRSNIDRQVFGSDRWPGARYYALHPIDSDSGIYYLLLGYRGYSQWNRQRIVDVLSFDAEGQPVFGAPIFLRQGQDPKRDALTRWSMDYSAQVNVQLHYDTILDALVFSHIIALPGQGQDGQPALVPDGSFEGYLHRDGLWWYKEKMFETTVDEAPGEAIPRQRRDLFGRPTKGRS